MHVEIKQKKKIKGNIIDTKNTFCVLGNENEYNQTRKY